MRDTEQVDTGILEAIVVVAHQPVDFSPISKLRIRVGRPDVFLVAVLKQRFHIILEKRPQPTDSVKTEAILVLGKFVGL